MKAALSEGMARADGAPSPELERLYRRWSTGGFGLIVTGNVMIDGRHLGEPGNVVVEDDRHADALRRWSATTAAFGTPLLMQVNHPGRQGSARISPEHPVAPSAVPSALSKAVTPRELADHEVVDIIARFATTAAIAEATGFNGVQIHAAHGYLVNQFLSPLSNQRNDRWGGDAGRRRTFLLEIIGAVRAAVGPGFAVAIKLNSADFQRGGFTEDESREVIRAVAGEGVDLIEVSGGSYETPAMIGAVRRSTQEREAYFLEYARTVREIADGTPIAVTGGFRTRSAMSAAVEAAECDIVGIGRPACLDPAAASALLVDEVERLFAPPTAFGNRAAPKALQGAVDLKWHADQLHRMGAGLEPDVNLDPEMTGGALAARGHASAERA